MNGGDASQFYLPLFETDLHGDAQHAGRFCIIMLTALIVSAVLLIWASGRMCEVSCYHGSSSGQY